MRCMFLCFHLRMRYLSALLIILLLSCQGNMESMDSSVAFESTDVNTMDTEQAQTRQKFYIFTNDFHSGLNIKRPYIRLVGATGESYVVPPLEYEDVETDQAIISGFKVKTGCIKIPGRSFPLKVNVCDTKVCKNSRYLADIMIPNHYGIAGVGGLLVPQVYPVSPCSEEFVQYIKNE